MFDKIKQAFSNGWTKLKEGVRVRLKQVSTAIGAILSALSIAWPQISASLPDAVTQIAPISPNVAQYLQTAAVIIGILLILWNSSHKTEPQ